MIDVYNTSPEIAAAKPIMAVIGVGAIEQHGRHLPVATDWSGVTDMSRRVAERLDAYWIPAIPFSMSECHGEMAGTVWINPDTLAKVVRDIVLSLHTQGINRVVIMNGHGGNFILEPTIQELNLSHPALVVIMPGYVPPADPPIFEAKGEIHAGEGETSSQLALNPELVKDQRVDYIPPVGREFLDYAFMSKLSPEGVWGDPSLGTIEKGLRAREHAVEQTVLAIQRTFETIEQLERQRADAGGNHV